MENDILDSLNDIGYTGPLTDDAALSSALDAGPKSLEYTKLVHLLAEELQQLCRLEETVHLMSSADDSSSFLLELSSFLKELGCPYKKMITGHISARLQTREERILLLDYLLSELMAARMVNVERPVPADSMNIVVQESPTAKDLKDILIALKFNKPPNNITAEILFNKLYTKLKETIDKEGPNLVGKPLYNKTLSEKEWKDVESSFTEMLEEYRLRRETLITRLECTIQSFEWSERMKSKKEEIQSAYRPHREAMRTKPDVRLPHFLAARSVLLHVEKTSSAAVRTGTRSEINKLIIGRVPDRGGRPSEQQPPPPEMPSWQQRPQGGGGGGGRGGRGGGRGGERGGRGGERGGRGGERGGRGGGERGGRGGGRVQGGWSGGGGGAGGDQGRGATASNYNSRPSTGHGGFQTFEVPPGGYSQNGQSSGYSTGGYGQSSGGYSQGYVQNQSSGHGGYGQGGAGYSQNSGYNQGYQQQPKAGYQTSYQSPGYQSPGYQSSGRGGYQNEHDDRTSDIRGGQRGQSNYSRGGRR